MSGVPEGTDHGGRRVSAWWLVVALVFAGYLVFRLVQGVAWLIQRM
ncbi:hypothetical protein FHU38_003344 [Saccharomonospora amisosensis]|uniref:Uncharacterized protein n=1 Tax=Saccharomonospora amisosensis TaxID=1128677 RepID=A0A7X5ZS53_9PSEU|nr:hypothetical protein [Saccharomonospora amisosensis]NIJ13000.1 hypothetical protein [Saccharomonospora amisosensis]